MKPIQLIPHLRRLITFGIVGLVGLAIQVSLFAVLHNQIGFHPVVAGGSASFITIFINFLLNSRFTWQSRLSTKRMARYYAVIVFGYAAYFAVFIPLLRFDLPPLLSNVLAALAAGIFNFILHSAWTFRLVDARNMDDTHQ